MSNLSPSETASGKAFEERPGPRDVLTVLFRHKWAALVLVGMSVLSTAVYLALSAPAYRADAKILARIGREKFSAINASQVPASSILFQERVQNVFNEVEILRDPSIIRAAFPALVAAIPPHTPAVPPTTLVAWLKFQVRAIASTAREFLQTIEEWIREPFYQLGLMQRFTEEEKLLAIMQRSFQIGFVKETDIIVVSYVSPDPEYSAKALDIILSSYRARHLKVHNPSNPTSFYEHKLAESEAQLAAIDGQLASFLKTSNTVSFSIEQQQDLTTITDSERQHETARLERDEANNRLNALSAQKGSGQWQSTPADAASAPTIASIDQRYVDLLAKRNELGTRFRDKSREMQAVNQDIAQLTDLKFDALVNYYRGRIRSLDQRMTMINTKATERRTALVGMTNRSLEFERLTDQKKNLLERILEYRRKIEQNRVSHDLDDQNLTSFSIVSPPVAPTTHSGPRNSLVLALSLLFGVILAAVYIGLAEALRQTLRNARDVRNALGLPVLATIPVLRSGRQRG